MYERRIIVKRISYLLSCCFIVFACNETSSPQEDLPDHLSEGGSGGAATEEPLGGSSPDREYFASSFPSQDTHVQNTPRVTDTPAFATEVFLNAGCEINPSSMSFASRRQAPMTCEHIVATAAGDVNGDYSDIALPFSWTSSSSAIEIHCLNGPNDNFCWPVSATDIFDTADNEEPCGTVTACAHNTCPPNAASCQTELCATVDVCAIVNIEGAWQFSWQGTDPDTTFFFTQTGRMFEDEWSDLDVGIIQGDHVFLEWGDYFFEGTISPDRMTISGTATDQITLSPAGTWTAAFL
jgi:hypothetical protein